MLRVAISIMLICLAGCFAAVSAQEVLVDYDGNVYPTVRIADQIWMGSNLNSTHDARGRMINRVCYKRISENCEKFGGLYAWDDLGVDGDSTQGICPDGWHVSTDEDWRKLAENIGGADSASYILCRDSLLGFNLQYGGNFHNRLRNFNYLGKIAYYWMADEFSTTAAWIRMLSPKNLNMNRSTVPKVYCLSVRCVKN